MTLPQPHVVILAAGRGERMHSSLPKVLHPLAGRPLIEHVYRSAAQLGPRAIYIVHGQDGKLLRQRLSHLDADWVLQQRPLGTGHALMQALPRVPEAEPVLVLCADVPLLRPETLRRLLAGVCQEAGHGGLALLSAELPDPSGYGRVLRDARGVLAGIMEERDASPEQRAIGEVCAGTWASARASDLSRWLQGLHSRNAQGEYYLGDVVAPAQAEGYPVLAVPASDPLEVQGVNSRLQLAQLERQFQLQQARELMERGVTLLDPARFDLRGEVRGGLDAQIDVNVILQGVVQLGPGVQIGSNCLIHDSVIGAGTHILPNSMIDQAEIGARCRLGPFCRIRPGSQLEEEVQVGNFVELKRAEVGASTKINHLSYVGDASLGSQVNVGCGTITCNYDGADKHRTQIGNDVFIGSGTQLIAPLCLGDGTTVAAGTTVTASVEGGGLVIGRSRQRRLPAWKRPGKRR